MPIQNKRKFFKKRLSPNKSTEKSRPVSKFDLDRLEFHRNAVALMPDPQDRRPGIAIRVEALTGQVGQQFCSCRTPRSKTCPHLKELSRVFSAFQDKVQKKAIADEFKSSIWYRLATVMADGSRETPETVKLSTAYRADRNVMEVFNARSPLLRSSAKAQAFAEKYGIAKSAGSDAHTPGEIGNAYVEMAEFNGKDDFPQALVKGKIFGHRTNPVTHFSSAWARLKTKFFSKG